MCHATANSSGPACQRFASGRADVPAGILTRDFASITLLLVLLAHKFQCPYQLPSNVVLVIAHREVSKHGWQRLMRVVMRRPRADMSTTSRGKTCCGGPPRRQANLDSVCTVNAVG